MFVPMPSKLAPSGPGSPGQIRGATEHLYPPARAMTQPTLRVRIGLSNGGLSRVSLG